MVEIFLKLIDKVIQLIKERQLNNDKIFNDLIEPIFNDMTLVAKDYFTMFSESYHLLAPYARYEKETDFHAISEQLKKVGARREEFLNTRIKVREMAKMLSAEISDPDIIKFTDSILKFFYGNEFNESVVFFESYSEQMSDIFDYLELDHSHYRLQAIVKIIEKVRENIEQEWINITEYYAVLRIKYLKPI